MGLLERVTRNQTACYWPPEEADEHGETTYGDPIEVGCFWMDVSELFLSSTGGEQVSNAKVIVDTDLLEGGLLRFGDMDSLTFADDPHENDKVFVIRKFERMPGNIRATKFYRLAIL